MNLSIYKTNSINNRSLLFDFNLFNNPLIPVINQYIQPNAFSISLLYNSNSFLPYRSIDISRRTVRYNMEFSLNNRNYILVDYCLFEVEKELKLLKNDYNFYMIIIKKVLFSLCLPSLFYSEKVGNEFLSTNINTLTNNNFTLVIDEDFNSKNEIYKKVFNKTKKLFKELNDKDFKKLKVNNALKFLKADTYSLDYFSYYNTIDSLENSCRELILKMYNKPLEEKKETTIKEIISTANNEEDIIDALMNINNQTTNEQQHALQQFFQKS